MMTIIDNPSLSKAHTYINETWVKSKTIFLSEYAGTTLPATLNNIFSACKTGFSTVVLGAIKGVNTEAPITFLSRKTYAETFGQGAATIQLMDDGRLISTRTLDVIEPAAIFFVDYDVNESTPDDFRNLGEAGTVKLLKHLLPEAGDFGYVWNFSSSSGLFDPNDQVLSPLERGHLYIAVDHAADLPKLKEVLMIRCIDNGFFWYRDLAEGRKSIQFPFDFRAMSPERLIYEAHPRLYDGITRQTTEPVLRPGPLLATEAIPRPSKMDIESAFEATETPKPGKGYSKQRITDRICVERDFTLLQADTEITLTNGEKTTVQAFMDSGVDKQACYAPFREDNNPSAFIARHPEKPNVCYLHDSGQGITYFFEHDQSLIVQNIDGLMRGKEKTIDSIREVLRMSGIVCRYDLIKKDVDIELPEEYNFSHDNRKNAAYTVIADKIARSGLKMSTQWQRDCVLLVADERKYNPVFDWITSKPWDKVDRFPSLANKLQVDPDKVNYRDIVLKRWCIQAIAAIHPSNKSGQKMELVLTLAGKQGIGKTSFFKSLAPKWILDGHTLNPQDKDSVKEAISYWIVELGELDATFRKSDIAQLKAFLSKNRDVMRMPYASQISDFPRRTVFGASVNQAFFLTDITGNRRYGALKVKIIDHSIIVDMQQFWAQALIWYENGESWWLTPEESALQTDQNECFESESPIKDKILSHFDFNQVSTEKNSSQMSATDILMEIGVESSRSNATQAGMILNELGLTAKKIGGRKLYTMPQKRSLFN